MQHPIRPRHGSVAGSLKRATCSLLELFHRAGHGCQRRADSTRRPGNSHSFSRHRRAHRKEQIANWPRHEEPATLSDFNSRAARHAAPLASPLSHRDRHVDDRRNLRHRRASRHGHDRPWAARPPCGCGDQATRRGGAAGGHADGRGAAAAVRGPSMRHRGRVRGRPSPAGRAATPRRGVRPRPLPVPEHPPRLWPRRLRHRHRPYR